VVPESIHASDGTPNVCVGTHYAMVGTQGHAVVPKSSWYRRETLGVGNGLGKYSIQTTYSKGKVVPALWLVPRILVL